MNSARITTTHWGQRKGFTLVELLVVIAIIGVLVSLMLPAIGGAREAGRRMQCTNNQKQMGLAVQTYHNSQKRIPPCWDYSKTFDYNTGGDISGASLHFSLLPYLEQSALYDKGKSDWATGYWGVSKNAVIETFLCPTDGNGPKWAYPSVSPPEWATTNYAGNYQFFGNPDAGDVGEKNMRSNYDFSKITDGLSRTMTFAERYRQCNEGSPSVVWAQGPWSQKYMAMLHYGPRSGAYAYGSWDGYGQGGAASKPQTNPSSSDCTWYLPQSFHPSGIQIGMADGSTHFISSSIDGNVWWGLCTPQGGEIVSIP